MGIANGPLSERSLQALEWPLVLEKLQGFAHTQVGKSLAATWMPGILSHSEAELQSQAVLEMRVLKSEKQLQIPLTEFPELKDILKRIEKSGAINVEEFRDLVKAQKIVQSMALFLSRYALQQKAMQRILGSLNKLEDWCHTHFALIDMQGEIVDSASEDLAALRQLSRELHQKIRNRLDEYLQNPRLAELMQDFYITLRDGRYVLPIKSNFKGRVPGIIHDVSNSEATLFIEPQDIVEWNNQLKITENEIEREIQRILAEVVQATKPHVEVFRHNQALAARADLMTAALEFAAHWGSDLCVTEWKGEEIFFKQLRHPLLSLSRNVVANDIAWTRFLMLTGPNTGGKTVLLKSVGLSLCLAWAGFPLPATEARLPAELNKVFVDIGDEQSLQENLSTFSAHLKVLNEMLREAGPHALMLIDEIATGTSPEEGQPLAQAVIEAFLDKGARGLVTTHYGALKQFALSDERARIAAMAFDKKTARPTYQILLDIPGESSAFETAAELGLSESVLKRARALRGEESSDLGKALKKLEETRYGFERKQAEMQEAVLKAQAREERAQKTLEEYALKQKQMLGEEGQKILKDISQLRDELSKAVKGASQSELSAGATNFFEKISDTSQQIRKQFTLGADKSAEPVDLGFEPGEIVEISNLGLGHILEMPKSAPQEPGSLYLVQVGELKSRVARSRLSKADGQQKKFYKNNRSSLDGGKEKKSFTLNPVGKSAAASRVCDVRGKNLEEALRRVETSLNELSRGDGDLVTIVHGHGTDKLKEGIRQYLGKREEVLFRSGSWPGEGGDGVTIVERS